MSDTLEDTGGDLILAAEECDPEQFGRLHKFAAFEERIIKRLVAHGPVLIRGGRGSGKSALLIEAKRRMDSTLSSSVFGVYLSLRYLPLLRATGKAYHELFCQLLSKEIAKELPRAGLSVSFPTVRDTGELQDEIAELNSRIGRRIVLSFDDAAHIGREASLEEFFDVFRVLSTDKVSCKASIYPGVTKFGIRFDVYNDASVFDLVRDERSPDFAEFFHNVMQARYPRLAEKGRLSRGIAPRQFAKLLGRAVVGNMRAFVFACTSFEEKSKIGLPEITQSFLQLASNYYWPLLEEVSPKLGMYEAFVQPAQAVGEIMFGQAGRNEIPLVVVHRDLVQRYSKLFEILEYAGFILRKEASRAMKSGGRGTVFALNLCNLLENVPQKRLTAELMRDWLEFSEEPAEFHSAGGAFAKIQLPEPDPGNEMGIFDLDIAKLGKSQAYPYGLTDNKVEVLKDAGFQTVRRVADATDAQLLNLPGVGQKMLKRIRDVVYQAIWM
jgi:hypothetical protein